MCGSAEVIACLLAQGYGDEDRAYVATQGPTVNTVGDFWRMVWQERSPIIVMITNLEEKNEVSAAKSTKTAMTILPLDERKHSQECGVLCLRNVQNTGPRTL